MEEEVANSFFVKTVKLDDNLKFQPGLSELNDYLIAQDDPMELEGLTARLASLSPKALKNQIRSFENEHYELNLDERGEMKKGERLNILKNFNNS